MFIVESYQLFFNEKKGLYLGSYLLVKARKYQIILVCIGSIILLEKLENGN